MNFQSVNDFLTRRQTVTTSAGQPFSPSRGLSFGAHRITEGQTQNIGMWKKVRLFIKFICNKLRTKKMKKNIKKCFARFSVLIRSGYKQIRFLNLLEEVFTTKSPTIKKSLLMHTSTNVAFALSLFMQQIGEISATSGANIGHVALGSIGLGVEVCNIMQMSVRMMSFLKLYIKSKRNPAGLSKAEKNKLTKKLSKLHISLMLTEAFTSLTGILSNIFRIVSAFLPGFSLAVIIPSLLSSLFSTFNAVLNLMEVIKQPGGILKKELLIHSGIILLNMLATACFLSQAILSVSPTPLSLIATLSFSLLQFVYIAINMDGLKEKIKQKLEESPPQQINSTI